MSERWQLGSEVGQCNQHSQKGTQFGYVTRGRCLLEGLGFFRRLVEDYTFEKRSSKYSHGTCLKQALWQLNLQANFLRCTKPASKFLRCSSSLEPPTNRSSIMTHVPSSLADTFPLNRCQIAGLDGIPNGKRVYWTLVRVNRTKFLRFPVQNQFLIHLRKFIPGWYTSLYSLQRWNWELLSLNCWVDCALVITANTNWPIRFRHTNNERGP